MSWVDWPARPTSATCWPSPSGWRGCARSTRCSAAAASSTRPGDIEWLTPAGAEMTEPDWQAGYAKSVAVLLNGTAISEPDPRGDPVTDNKFLLLFNAGAEPIAFTLPEPGSAASGRSSSTPPTRRASAPRTCAEVQGRGDRARSHRIDVGGIAMRPLHLPGGDDADLDDGALARLYAYPQSSGAWVRANMVASLDGAAESTACPAGCPRRVTGASSGRCGSWPT